MESQSYCLRLRLPLRAPPSPPAPSLSALLLLPPRPPSLSQWQPQGSPAPGRPPCPAWTLPPFGSLVLYSVCPTHGTLSALKARCVSSSLATPNPSCHATLALAMPGLRPVTQCRRPALRCTEWPETVGGRRRAPLSSCDWDRGMPDTAPFSQCAYPLSPFSTSICPPLHCIPAAALWAKGLPTNLRSFLLSPTTGRCHLWMGKGEPSGPSLPRLRTPQVKSVAAASRLRPRAFPLCATRETDGLGRDCTGGGTRRWGLRNRRGEGRCRVMDSERPKG